MATLPPPEAVAIIVLAAGTSSRLGRPKQFLDIKGQPLILRVAHVATASSAEYVFVVAGEFADETRVLLSGTRATVVPNPAYKSGQASSVLAGIGALPDSVAAVLFLLGDQPQITTSIIDRLIANWHRTNAPIVQASYRGTPAHPVLFGRELFPELQTISGDSGAAPVVRAHRNEIVLVEFDEDVPLDVDTEDDYQFILSRL